MHVLGLRLPVPIFTLQSRPWTPVLWKQGNKKTCLPDYVRLSLQDLVAQCLGLNLPLYVCASAPRPLAAPLIDHHPHPAPQRGQCAPHLLHLSPVLTTWITNDPSLERSAVAQASGVECNYCIAASDITSFASISALRTLA